MGPVSNFFGGRSETKKNTESRSHLVSGMWRKYFSSWEIIFGILRVTAKFFVKNENIFPPRRKKVGKNLRVTATLYCPCLPTIAVTQLYHFTTVAKIIQILSALRHHKTHNCSFTLPIYSICAVFIPFVQCTSHLTVQYVIHTGRGRGKN